MGRLRSVEVGILSPISGSSSLSEQLSRDIERLASSRNSVVIVGEPGSGKRHAAMHIHAKSKDEKGGEFWEIRPQTQEGDLRSLLFGESRRRSREEKVFRKLDARATLFIKDIHEFSFMNQTRLARFFIQNDIGGSQGKPAPRIVVPTSVPWAELVKQHMVVTSIDHYVRYFDVLVVPPLRERIDDIPLLVQAFVEERARDGTKHNARIDVEGLKRLRSYQWNGNVKELRLLVEEAMEYSSGGVLKFPNSFFDEIALLKDTLRSIQTGKRCKLEETVGFLEQAIIQRALKQTDFDRHKTARLLGLNEKNLFYRIKKHKIWMPDIGKRKSR